MSLNLKLIGGSDIAAILGLNPYKSAIDVYDRIVNGVDSVAGRPAERGKRLEKAILEWWADENPKTPLSNNKSILSGELEPFRWSLDAITMDNEIVEIKTVGSRARHQWDDGPPIWYRTQCHWYMHWMKSPRCHLVVFNGDDISTTVIERDMAEGEFVQKSAQTFWDGHVLTKIPPPPDGSESYSEYQGRQKHKEASVTVNDAASLMLIDDFRAKKEAVAKAEKEFELARQRIILLMSEANDTILSPNLRITYKEQARKTVRWEKLMTAVGVSKEMKDRYTTESKYKVLRTY